MGGVDPPADVRVHVSLCILIIPSVCVCVCAHWGGCAVLRFSILQR